MINLEREIEKNSLKSQMLLQVHDELIFEVPSAELKEMKAIVPELMTSAIELSVPLKAAVKTGPNWGEME
jgi:DNA polymerase-1